jgi:lipoprotein-releasing system permease protein
MIFSQFERTVAWRYLRAKRQEGFISVISWFSLIGIALGVATLIVVMSVMNGFRVELFQRVLGLNGHFNIYSMQTGPLNDYQSVLDRVSKIQGVIAAAPTVEGQALVTQGGAATGVYVRGVMPEAMRQRQTIAKHVLSGSLDDFGGDSIAIGVRLAERLNLMVGQNLTLISPVSKTTIFGAAPRMRAYKIAAIFDVGMYEYDNGFVFMPLQAAQAFYSMGEGVTSIEIFVQDPQNLVETRKDIIAAADKPDAPAMRLLDWKQNNSSFVTALEVEKNVMFLILTMMIIIAAFNIITGLIMLVKDKGSDIAILRTMGATRGMVMRIFFLNGAAIGIFGTFFGFLLGLFVAGHIEQLREVIQKILHIDPFSPEVYFLTRMPSVIDTKEVIQVVALSLGLSFLATLYPSWRAARLDPVEALRYE